MYEFVACFFVECDAHHRDLHVLPHLFPTRRSAVLAGRATREVRAELRRRTAAVSGAGMQIGRDQGALFQVLVKLTGARRCLEVGVFTGYSSLAVGLALPPEGQITACDIDPKPTAIAPRFLKKRSQERRVGKECGSTGRARCSRNT